MELSPYPRASAFGIKDILNEMKKKRIAREEENEKRFPMQTIRGLNAASGVPVRDPFNTGTGIGNPLGAPQVSGVNYQGRNIYQSINRLQGIQMRGLRGLTPKTVPGARIRGGKGKGGRAVPRSRKSTRSYGGGAKGQVRSVAARYGWDKGKQWRDLKILVQKESSWRPGAANPTSSARGLFQKMTSLHGPVEKGAKAQARWGLKYIKGRHKTPSQALAFHRRNNWY